ncbi:MAG: hypothetical protein Q9M19_07430, partial [Mariprofundaceae bacterium]|nr:hypothetical protein [Mariprofundaceae bacterium]
KFAGLACDLWLGLTMERKTGTTRRRKMKDKKMIMAILVVGLLTLNGCMIKHMTGDDEGMSSHEDMPMHNMMQSSDEDDDDEDMSMEDMNDE